MADAGSTGQNVQLRGSELGREERSHRTHSWSTVNASAIKTLGAQKYPGLCIIKGREVASTWAEPRQCWLGRADCSKALWIRFQDSRACSPPRSTQDATARSYPRHYAWLKCDQSRSGRRRRGSVDRDDLFLNKQPSRRGKNRCAAGCRRRPAALAHGPTFT